MKNKTFLLNTALTVILGIFLGTLALIRAFQPAAVLPGFDIPTLTALCLLALLAEHYLAKGKERCIVCSIVLAFAAFGILPWAAGFGSWRLALRGVLVFTVCTILFTSICTRLKTGPQAKAAPVVSALCLYLASQIFMGM